MKDEVQLLEEQIQAMQKQLNDLKTNLQQQKDSQTEATANLSESVSSSSNQNTVSKTTQQSYPAWNAPSGSTEQIPPPPNIPPPVLPPYGRPQNPYYWNTIPPRYTPPPVQQSPPPPKKEWDQQFARKFMGILASGLVLIGVILMIALLPDRLAKLIALCIVGAGLVGTGIIGERKKPVYQYFFCAIAGLGCGIIYLSIFFLRYLFPNLHFFIFYSMVFIWAAALLLLARQKNIIYPTIGLIGVSISIFVGGGTNEPKQLLFLTILISAVSLLYVLLSRPEQKSLTILSLILTSYNIAALFLRILSRQFREITYIGYWITSVGILIGLSFFLVLWYTLRVERPAAKPTEFGVVLAIGHLLLILCNYLLLMHMMDATSAERALVGSVLLVIYWFCLHLSGKRGTAFQFLSIFILILHMILMLASPSLTTVLIWAVVTGTIFGYGLVLHRSFYCSIAYLYGLIGVLPVAMRLEFFDALSFSNKAATWLLLSSVLQIPTVACRQWIWSEKEHALLYILHVFLVGNAMWMLQLPELLLPLRILLAVALTVLSLLYLPAILARIRSGNQGYSILLGILYTVIFIAILHAFIDAGYWISSACLLLAIGYIMIGFRRKYNTIRKFGLILTMICLFKLLVIDLVDLVSGNSWMRAVCFIVSGLLCFLISFIYNKMSSSDR